MTAAQLRLAINRPLTRSSSRAGIIHRFAAAYPHAAFGQFLAHAHGMVHFLFKQSRQVGVAQFGTEYVDQDLNQPLLHLLRLQKENTINFEFDYYSISIRLSLV